MNARVPIEPLSIELEQSYTEEGTAVATVVATLQSGQSLRLYEGDGITILSTTVPREAICLLARPKMGAERRRAVTPRIEQPADPDTEWSYNLYGTLEETDVTLLHGDTETAYLLDIGVGTILVDPIIDDLLPTSETPLAVGDALFVPTSRVEFHDDQFLETEQIGSADL